MERPLRPTPNRHTHVTYNTHTTNITRVADITDQSDMAQNWHATCPQQPTATNTILQIVKDG